MATLTLDLPEAPRAQAAYRLAADCPCCGAPLVLRQNRQTATLFTGCSAYPGCAFAEPHDPRVQTLRLSNAGGRQVHAEARRQVAHAQADAQRHVAAERATLDRTVRQLIALAHPDRWPDTPLAHELTVALVGAAQDVAAWRQARPIHGPVARRRWKMMEGLPGRHGTDEAQRRSNHLSVLPRRRGARRRLAAATRAAPAGARAHRSSCDGARMGAFVNELCPCAGENRVLRQVNCCGA